MNTILVIEDNPEMRANIAEILELAPYQVVQAANGKLGVSLAREHHPDLILCDIMMPGLDGYGVLHIVSKDPDLAGLPFIFLTAKAETTDFRFGMNLGADDYLTKPFDDIALLNAVALRLKKGRQSHTELPIDAAHLLHLMQAFRNVDDARERLCKNYPTSFHRRKQLLFMAGGMPTSLYFIRRGLVKLFTSDHAGNTYITGLYGAGDFVGYLPLVATTPYTESAEVLDEAEVCSIPQAVFLSLIYSNQEVANEFIQMLAQDVAESRERLLKLAYQSVRKRTAEALLIVYRKFYPGQAPVMTLSRENWSQLVGASTETVIRTLSDFRNEGIIEISKSQITLLDIEKLARIKR